MAYYTHAIPIFLTVFLILFVLKKTSFSLLSRTFSLFTGVFCLWFIGSLVTWTVSDYNFVAFFWSPLDYINVVFYLLGLYFFLCLVREKDLSILGKIFLAIPAFPAWWITFKNQSLGIFDQSVCEASNNDFITHYKIWLEIIVIGFLMFYAFLKARLVTVQRRIQIGVVCFSLVLFFSVFAISEYLGSITGVYELNFYNLFLLPVFLFLIIYSIANLELLHMRLVGTQLLSYTLIIMVGSQLFFTKETSSFILMSITFVLTLGFSILLIKSSAREATAREQVEKLAVELKTKNESLRENDRQKDELLGLVSHQLATPVAGLRWDLEMFTEGDLGPLNEKQKEELMTMVGVTGNLSDLVSMILDVSRIQLGRMKVDKAEIELAQFFKEITEVLKPKSLAKNQEFVIDIPKELSRGCIDKRLSHMTIENLLSNAVKYTPEKGKVELRVTLKEGRMLVQVSDTGCGIPKKDQDKIFGKLFRASNVASVDGNGFGLYIAKGAIEAQGGKIWFESEEGKGTTFYVDLPISQKCDTSPLRK